MTTAHASRHSVAPLLLQGLRYGITPIDPVTIVGGPVLLIVIASGIVAASSTTCTAPVTTPGA